MNNHTLVSHFGVEPTETRLSLINSIITTTSVVGNALSIIFLLPLADSKGRKYTTVYLRFAITFVTALCQLLAAVFQSSEIYILGQFVIGLHESLRSFATAVYLLECAPDNCRGFASTALIFSFVIAKMFMFSVASPNVLGTIDTWFLFPLFAMISSVVVLSLTIRLPESPKWLVQQNRMNEARDSIQFYHGKNCIMDEVVPSLIREKNLTEGNKLSLRQIWANDTLREACKIVLAVMFFLEFDTSYVQSIYTIDFHKTAGFSVQTAMNINFIITTVLFPTKFIGTYLLDGVGRRPAMYIAGSVQYCKTLLILATETIIFICGSSLLTQIMYIVVEILVSIVPATGVNSLRFLFVSELFPPSARTAVGQAMLFSSMAISDPLVSLFPIVNSIFPPIFFAPFVFTQLVIGVYLYRHMPETRGRAVYDIIESMDKDVASRAASIFEETTPLIRNRARTLAVKRNSILNTPRTRALTFDHKFIPKN